MQFQQNKDLTEFNQLNQKLEEFYHEIALRQDLSDSAFWILRALLELGDGCTQKEICAYTWMNKQTINSSVKKMEKQGLLFLKSGKGREVKVSLTDKGKELAWKNLFPVVAAESEVFDEMSEEERKELLRLTELFLNKFQKKINHWFSNSV